MISDLLSKDEQILWQGKPNLIVFLIKATLPTFFAGIIWTLMVIAFFGVFWSLAPANTQQPQTVAFRTFSMVFSIPFFAFGIYAILSPLWTILSYRNYAYFVTNKQIIISRGKFGRDYKFFDFKNIKSLEINIGLIDKFFNTGSILFSIGELIPVNSGTFTNKEVFFGIKEPYKAYTQIKNILDTYNQK